MWKRTRQYLEANESALCKYRELCRDIDCDYEEKPSYVYSLDDRLKIEKAILALEKLARHAEFTQRLPLPFSVAGAVKYPNQAQFHPLKFYFRYFKGITHFRAYNGAGTGWNHIHNQLW